MGDVKTKGRRIAIGSGLLAAVVLVVLAIVATSIYAIGLRISECRVLG